MKTNRTSAEILKSLAGTKKEFVRALIELTWFRYDFTIADVEYAGKARKHLILGLECAGQTDQENVWVYRLNMPDGTLNDARRAVESQLQQRPEFAVFFVVIRDAIVVAVPASDTKGAHGDALVAGCIPLNTRHPANFEDEMLRRLADAPRNRFKSVLRDITSVEKVTKKFYEEFKKQKDAFITAIKGINDKVKDDSDRKWYASVILDRLMFLYFIQSNGLLNGDLRYLASRLESHAGYYRKFLLPLFFDGLAVDSEKRKSGTNALLGDIPYLNGGLFQQHKLETDYPDIEIADSAFQAIFKFFDQYTWHIDDRPLAVEREINPDVLGFIFEKYVNQKEMGAYYTKEDITGYICRNTIIPRLFDMLAEAGHTIEPLPIGSRDSNLDISEGDGIDRYIYNAVKTTDYLPTETEREYTARRKRYESILQDFKDGKITSVNDFITYNLDIEEMAQDFAAGIRDARVLSDFYFVCLKKITVLDPTCGSGAFLFAALKILYPLYEACLARMRILCDENPPAPTGTLVGTFAFDNQVARQTALLDIRTISDPVRHAFRKELDRIAEHPNSKYYITKTIIVNNLFGVDIENEAVEICKLRLFLKLASHAEPDATKPNHGIEPLPDIDFNIRAGNTLVGYVNRAEVDSRFQTSLGFKWEAQELLDRLIPKLEAYTSGTLEGHQDPDLKVDIEIQKQAISKVLDEEEYQRRQRKTKSLEQFVKSHRPFHWLVEFPKTISSGGFDVVVGNPPYVDYVKRNSTTGIAIRDTYEIMGFHTLSSGNLYAFCVERAIGLLSHTGRFGMIVPIASVSTDGMCSLQDIYRPLTQWHSHYAVRPGKLFVGVDMNLTITLLLRTDRSPLVNSTRYMRWSGGTESDRPYLFDRLEYVSIEELTEQRNPLPKLGTSLEVRLLKKMLDQKHVISDYVSSSGSTIYYHSGGRYWRKALTECLSSHYKPLTVPIALKPVVCALLNSQLHYWYWICHSNCMDVVSREVLEMPVFALDASQEAEFGNLVDRLYVSYYASNSQRLRSGERIHVQETNFDVSKSKPIIDEIDRALAEHYGFTEEELDFIINYDIKYRMGNTD